MWDIIFLTNFRCGKLGNIYRLCFDCRNVFIGAIHLVFDQIQSRVFAKIINRIFCKCPVFLALLLRLSTQNWFFRRNRCFVWSGNGFFIGSSFILPFKVNCFTKIPNHKTAFTQSDSFFYSQDFYFHSFVHCHDMENFEDISCLLHGFGHLHQSSRKHLFSRLFIFRIKIFEKNQRIIWRNVFNFRWKQFKLV